MKKSLALMSFALAVAGCSGENETTTEKNAAMNSMIDNAVGSHSLIPHTKGKNNDYTGTFDLIVKQQQFSNDNSFSKAGQQGTTLCSIFKIYNPFINSAGKMNLTYSRYVPGYKYGHTEYASAPLEDMEPVTLLNVPYTISDGKFDYGLNPETKTVCRFTPK